VPESVHHAGIVPDHTNTSSASDPAVVFSRSRVASLFSNFQLLVSPPAE
jgi:hypothetical protein